MGVEAWSTTAASNNASPPNGAPEGMAASAVNDCIRQVMADVRSQLQDGQWLNWGHTPTRVDDDTFTVATDLTATYHAGRRLKVTGSATGYCTIASSSYSAPNTTVNVTMDTGNLPGTLSAVYVALLSGSNISVPLLSASILTSGSLADARLSSNVPLKDAANTFTAAQTFTSVGGAVNVRFIRDASNILDVYHGGGVQHIDASAASSSLSLDTVGAQRIVVSSVGNVTINAPSSGISLTATGAGSGVPAVKFYAAAPGEYIQQWSDGVVGAYIATAAASAYYEFGTYTNTPLRIVKNFAGKILIDSGVQIGSATGGDKGADTLNVAGAIYQNNVAVALTPLISVGAALNISTIAVGQSAYIYKSANTSRTTDSTLTIDPVLQFTSAPAGTYATEGNISVSNADSTADFKISWPRGVDDSGVLSMAGYDNAATSFTDTLPFRSGSQEHAIFSGGSSTMAISVRGIEVATAGQTLGPLWAQATAHASATAVRSGSWLKVTRLS